MELDFQNIQKIPKPMVKINKKPIIFHIMKHYAKFDLKIFLLQQDIKQVLKNYFRNKNFGWKINIIDTGPKTMTGGRLKRLKKILKK